MSRFKVKNISCITTEDINCCIDLSEYIRNQAGIMLEDNKIYKRPRIIFTPKKTHVFEIYDEVQDDNVLTLLYNVNKKLDIIISKFNTTN
jgi:hypothetical protein